MKNVNELALACQKKGRVSDELYKAVKGVSWALFNKRHVDADERTGLAGIAVCEALRCWDSSRGDFCLALHYQTLKVINEEFLHMSEIVRKPQRFRDREYQTIKTVYPDGVESDETVSDSFWDVLIRCEPETDDGYGVARVELKKAVESLSEENRAIYDWVFVDGMTQNSFASEHGLTRQAVNHRVKRLVKMLTKKVKKSIDKQIKFPTLSEKKDGV